MSINKRNIVVVIIVAVVAIAASVGIFLLWKPEPKGIVVAVSNLPDSLNPVLGQNTSGLNADELVFDGLVNFEVDPQSGKLYPELALAELIEQDQEELFGAPQAGLLARRNGAHLRGRRLLLRCLYR
jgi:peptide/nickel transport system substrate-binding protein